MCANLCVVYHFLAPPVWAVSSLCIVHPKTIELWAVECALGPGLMSCLAPMIISQAQPERTIVVFGHSEFFYFMSGYHYEGEFMGHWMENGEVFMPVSEALCCVFTAHGDAVGQVS